MWGEVRVLVPIAKSNMWIFMHMNEICFFTVKSLIYLAFDGIIHSV